MKHYILFFIAILCLSQAANLVRAAEAPALMIGFWRLLGAALLMALLRLFNFKRTQHISASHFWEPLSAKTWTWTAISGSFFFLHLWSFFYAVQNTTIAHCMVIFATNPLFTALGAWVLLKDRFEKRHAMAFIAAFVGVYFLVSENFTWTRGPLENTSLGDFSSLASAAFFSIYILAGKKARFQMSTDQFAWLIYSWAAILFFVAGCVQNIRWTGYPSSTWLAIVGNILFPTLLGHVLFTYLLKYLNINWMSCGKLIEPMLSSAVAWVAFNEKLKSQTYTAFGFTVLSVLILFWPQLQMLKARKN